MAKKTNSSARYAFLGARIAAIGCVATRLLALVQGTVALSFFTPAKAGNPHAVDCHQRGRSRSWGWRSMASSIPPGSAGF